MPSPKLYWDDLHVGQRFVSGTATVNAEELKQFAAKYDPQPFHLDEQEASSTLFGGLAASGWHTAALTMRLIVESVPLSEGIIGTSGEITWPCPTRPGDTLQVESVLLALAPSRSNPARGSAALKSTTRNQNAEIVQTFTCKIVVARRPAAVRDDAQD